jgi:hypothetical protein
LNEQWHSRLPYVGGFYIDGLFFGGFFGPVCYAVAGWSAPIARMLTLKGKIYYELRRFAIAPDAPRNTASRMLAFMVRYIKKTKPKKDCLISYQDTEVHTGTIYKAVGWNAAHISKANDQNWVKTHGRPSSSLQTTAPKIRWEKQLD